MNVNVLNVILMVKIEHRYKQGRNIGGEFYKIYVMLIKDKYNISS